MHAMAPCIALHPAFGWCWVQINQLFKKLLKSHIKHFTRINQNWASQKYSFFFNFCLKVWYTGIRYIHLFIWTLIRTIGHKVNCIVFSLTVKLPAKTILRQKELVRKKTRLLKWSIQILSSEANTDHCILRYCTVKQMIYRLTQFTTTQ